VIPEQDPLFRLARLLLLLAVVEDAYPAGIDLERLGMYDFLAAHPLLLARAEDDPDRAALLLAGFDDRALAYASPAQRFVDAQLGLRADVARLVGYGLAAVTTDGRIRFRVTDSGHVLAGRFTAMYARAYTAAARIVVRRLRRLSGRKLRHSMREWLTVKAGPDRARLDPADVMDLYPTRNVTPATGTVWRTGFPEDIT
jgi:hypothetical protein